MSELVKERPANPIEYLANYLLQHDPQRTAAAQPQPPKWIQMLSSKMDASVLFLSLVVVDVFTLLVFLCAFIILGWCLIYIFVCLFEFSSIHSNPSIWERNNPIPANATAIDKYSGLWMVRWKADTAVGNSTSNAL